MPKLAKSLFTALAACVFALAYTPTSAQYPYGGVIVEEVPIAAAQLPVIQAAGFTNPRTWRVYVCVEEPDWAIVQLFTNITGSVLLSTWEASCPTCTGADFYQESSFGPVNYGVSSFPAFYGVVPGYQYDSWWSIGNPGPPSNTATVGPALPGVEAAFNAGNAWFTDDGFSSLFIPSTNACFALPVGGRILIGQFTTDGVLEGNVAITLSRRLAPAAGCIPVTPVQGFIVNNVFFTNDFAYSYGDATCLDMPSCPDFGSCSTVLGAAKINGVCTEITGCDFLAGGVDYSPFTFPSLQECIESTDFGPGPCYGLPSCIDFGNCGNSLGFTRVGGSCVEAFGCSTTVGPTDYSPFFYNTIDECVVACSQIFLSVDLTEYTARAVDNDQVRLRWITSSETNSDHYTVEHSTDMENWTLIDTQKAAGFSSEQLVYTSYDRTPSDGTNYYRLRQFDTDGSEQLREIRSVDFKASGPIPYPNPTTGNLRFKGDMSTVMFIRVSGMDGRTLLHYPVNGAASPELDLSRLASGSYLVHLETASGRVFHHVVQKH